MTGRAAPRTRGQLGVADVAVAWDGLAPADDATRNDIARLLGFALPAPRPVTPASTPRLVPAPTLPSTGGPVAPPVAPVDLSAPRTASARPVTATRAGRAPEWRRRLRPSGYEARIGGQPATDALERETGRPAVARLEPLLRPGAAALVVMAATATDAADGDLDVDALVATAALRRPVTALPRRPRPSLLQGVQLLVDVGPGMAPFHRDAEHLAAVVRATVGPRDLPAVLFAGAPTRGAGAGPRPDWEPYRPPGPGTPVFAVTDLGLGGTPGAGRALPDEWLGVDDLLRRRGSPLVLLVPYPSDRWPPALAGLRLVPWDRSTTVATVRRAVGRVLGGRRV